MSVEITYFEKTKRLKIMIKDDVKVEVVKEKEKTSLTVTKFKTKTVSKAPKIEKTEK